MKNKISKSMLLLVLAAFAICNLPANEIKSSINKDHNIIYLVGEDHSDKEARKFKEFLFQEAKNGNIIFAVEGADFDEKLDDNTFGIDESSVAESLSSLYYHTLLSVYKMAQDVSSRDDTKLLLSRHDVKGFLRKSLLSNCVYHLEQMCGSALALDMELDAPEKDDLFLKCKELLLGIHDSGSSMEDHSVIKNNSLKTPFFLNLHQDINQWLKLFKNSFEFSMKKIMISNDSVEVSDALSDMALMMAHFQEYLEEDIEEMSNIERLDMLTVIVEDCRRVMQFVVDHLIKLRDPVLLNNIIRTFEENKSLEMPFYANVGLKHIPFVYEGLKKRGYLVELNEVAQAQYDEFLEEQDTSSKEEL